MPSKQKSPPRSYPRRANVKEVAEYLGENEAWVRRHVYMKDIPFYKHGQNLRFDLDKIDEWERQHEHTPEAS